MYVYVNKWQIEESVKIFLIHCIYLLLGLRHVNTIYQVLQRKNK